ncbi:hypothetical protein, partial [Halalkalibacter flavus]|uniref:hypothetical protein n=1 Tax=Halalkalibacter flavus TaxID=3090668 RepID=UPI002FCCB381
PYRVNFFNEISCISISLGFCSVFKELLVRSTHQRQKSLYHTNKFRATSFLKQIRYSFAATSNNVSHPPITCNTFFKKVRLAINGAGEGSRTPTS